MGLDLADVKAFNAIAGIGEVIGLLGRTTVPGAQNFLDRQQHQYTRRARTRRLQFHFRPRFERPLWGPLLYQLLPKTCLETETVKSRWSTCRRASP